jgi:uncharacterized membrane protein
VSTEAAAVTRRDIRQTGTFRSAVIFGAVVNAFAAVVIALAAGPLLALVPAVAVIACLVVALGQTRHLRSLRRQELELNRPAGQIEARLQKLEEAHPCTHAAAEPVDLTLTGLEGVPAGGSRARDHLPAVRADKL